MGDGPVGSGGPPATEGGPSSLRFPVRARDDINTLAHYYRGEMGRMISWRDRMDRTTNWAIGAVAAMLSVSLASPVAHHGVLIFSMMVTYLLLHIEARRYRFYDVYRTRVRLLERNYYSSFFHEGGGVNVQDWGAELGESLRYPRFHITLRQAMARRLLRNYRWVFLILLAAWFLKTTTTVLAPPSGRAEFVHSVAEFLDNAGLGYLPGWAVVIGVAAFYGWLVYVMSRYRTPSRESAFGEVYF